MSKQFYFSVYYEDYEGQECIMTYIAESKEEALQKFRASNRKVVNRVDCFSEVKDEDFQ